MSRGVLLLFVRCHFCSVIAFSRLFLSEYPFVSFHLLGPFVAPPQHVAAAAEEESKWWSLEKR